VDEPSPEVALKLAYAETAPDAIDVVMRGELEVASCTCLSNFWALRVAGRRDIALDMRDVDAHDGPGVATLASLVHEALRGGARVTIRHAPQMVAHTLYKIGRLREGGALRLEAPRVEEPYGG